MSSDLAYSETLVLQVVNSSPNSFLCRLPQTRTLSPFLPKHYSIFTPSFPTLLFSPVAFWEQASVAPSDRGMWDVPVQQFTVKGTESLTPPEGNKFLAAVNLTVTVEPVFREGLPEKVGAKKKPPEVSPGEEWISMADARRRLRGNTKVVCGASYGSLRCTGGPEAFSKGVLQYASEETLEGFLNSSPGKRGLEKPHYRVYGPTVKRCKK